MAVLFSFMPKIKGKIFHCITLDNVLICSSQPHNLTADVMVPNGSQTTLFVSFITRIMELTFLFCHFSRDNRYSAGLR